MNPNPRDWRQIASRIGAILLAMLASVVVTISLVESDDGAGHKTRTLQIKVNEAKGDGQPTKTVTVSGPVLDQSAAVFPDKGARDETPPIAEQKAPGELTAAQKAAARIKATQDPLPTAGASAGFPGCVTRYVANQSSRHGVRPQLQVLHYTVSPNRAGWSDVNAIIALFDRSSAQASSNFVIDAEGHCAYIVPIESKSWTQAAANPYSISYEIVNTGSEATYLASPGYLQLGRTMLEVSHRTGIPVSAGAVRGCVPTRRGVIQHKDLGLCGGGHHDIAPFSLGRELQKIRAAGGAGAKPITAAQRSRCGELNRLRAKARRRGWHSPDLERANAIKAGETKHGLRCLSPNRPHRLELVRR